MMKNVTSHKNVTLPLYQNYQNQQNAQNENHKNTQKMIKNVSF